MDLFSITPSVLIAAIMVAAVPIILAAIGELVVEKAGVLNLGVEGMMIMGAVCGFVTAVQTQSAALGFFGGALGAAALSLVFALLTQYLMTNQVATGLALTMFGLGLSSLIGQEYGGILPPEMGDISFGLLAKVPVLGKIFFQHDLIVYLSIFFVAGVWAVLKYTHIGLVLRAVGDNHDAAHALGYKVIYVRILAIMFGGFMAGLGGSYIALIRVPQWTDGITAGAGWIALAIVVFASWKPWRILLGAYIFGGITVLQLNLQAAGVNIPVEYLSMSPYLITIIVLVVMSSDKSRATLAAPASLAHTFHASR